MTSIQNVILVHNSNFHGNIIKPNLFPIDQHYGNFFGIKNLSESEFQYP